MRITSTGICGSDLHLYEVMGAFAYEMFQKKQDGAIKILLTPWAQRTCRLSPLAIRF